MKIHPDVKAWREWRESDEGKRCLNGQASGEYLENRLSMAFSAGCNAAVRRTADAAGGAVVAMLIEKSNEHVEE